MEVKFIIYLIYFIGHTLNLEDGLTKISINNKGEPIPNKNATQTRNLNRDQIFELTQDQIKNGEGCRVKGSFEVKRVPGNFHISAHGFRDIIQRIRNVDPNFKFDFTHTINHLSFGEEIAQDDIHNDFKVGIFHPLDSVSKKDNSNDNIFEELNELNISKI